MILSTLTFLLALIGALGAFKITCFFYRDRREPLMQAFAVFFTILSVGFIWLSITDFLTLTGNFNLARSPIRAIVFRSLMCGAILQLHHQIFRPIGNDLRNHRKEREKR